MADYIGQHFSLISSTARIRYTGVLARVNQEDGSIILDNGTIKHFCFLICMSVFFDCA